MRRDEGWQSMRLGRFLERAGRSTRLVQAHQVARARLMDEDDVLDLHGWRALLGDAMAAGPPPLVLARTARDMVEAAARKPWGGLEVGDLIERLPARCTSIDVALGESCFLASYERTPIGQHAQASRKAQN